jgi:GNAT superfamily N-acetyltransferase
MDILIRKAIQEDCPQIMTLVHELAEFERAPDEVSVSLEHFRESGFGPSPVWWAFVAEVNDRIVGFALYYIRYSTWKGRKMYLEDILVTEEWRCRGIGTRLMEALIREAKDKQLNGISWQVLEWNEPAISFYRRYQPKFDNEWVNVMMDVQ